MRAAGARWTEEDLTKFTRNSGRGLPKPTLQHIANTTGEAVDKNGEPLPATPAELQAREKVRETKRKMEPAKRRRPKGVAMTATEAHIRATPKAKDNKFIHNLAKSADAQRQGKYKNTKRVRDGIRFDSILEADYYTQLEFERKAGIISYYLRQVPMHLPGGVILRVDFVTFTATDSFVEEKQFFEVHYIDTKGFHTRESKNKIKMAEHLYGIKIEIVKKVRKLRS